ncbi:MAG TPA: hypothetical protein VEJ86_06075, partial [Candidatus Binataceae bacterium]|nr:hypothetical protein [Candidatus Binataceae bacterium]
VLAALASRLSAAGFRYRTFQVGAGDDYSGLLDELRNLDLFAPKRLIACRVLKTRRGAGEDSADAEVDSRTGAADEGALAQAIEKFRGPGHLVLVYERDTVPAKIRRVVDKSGTSVGCLRPFENQIVQYAEAFARAQGLKLAPAALDLLIARHEGDLAAIANAVAKAAIVAEPPRAVGPEEVDEPSGRRMPGTFEIAESLGRGRAAVALQQIDRAIELGRDPIEILALEVIPLLRRMVLAASMLARRKSGPEIAAAMGFPPSSMLANRAIDGARQFGLARLTRAWRQASTLDAQFKMGLIKERQQALNALVMELAGAN